MPTPNDPIEPLRAALEVSPDNEPLRRHLAASLTAAGRHGEAVEEYRRLLEGNPAAADLKLLLADAYLQDDRLSEAAVILEAMLDHRDPPAQACVMYARLCLREGRVEDAVTRYKQALEADPESHDEELSERLGVSATPQTSIGSDWEVDEGRLLNHAGDAAGDFQHEVERPKIAFDDVGGMKDLKEEIRVKIIYPLEHPEVYAAYGKTIGGGIMLYGPPGCGKTYLARATAGQINAGFLSIGISDVLDMYIGQSEKQLHQVFAQARANTPCVLFFDEVDALGAKRSDLRGGGQRQLINQFLAELDGVEHSNEGVLVLAATNAPWHVDPAFRRPGRFDRVMFVPPPDDEARADILRLHLAGKPTRDIDYTHLAKNTKNYSGADLKALVDLAVEAKLTESIKRGSPPQPLTGADLRAAAKKHKPTTTEWFSSARNYALYANEGGLYDDVLKWIK